MPNSTSATVVRRTEVRILGAVVDTSKAMVPIEEGDVPKVLVRLLLLPEIAVLRTEAKILGLAVVSTEEGAAVLKDSELL